MFALSMKHNVDILLTLMLFSSLSFYGLRPVTVFMVLVIFLFIIRANKFKIYGLLRLAILCFIILVLAVFSLFQNFAFDFSDRPLHLGLMRPILLMGQLSVELTFCAAMLSILNINNPRVEKPYYRIPTLKIQIFDVVLMLMIFEYLISSFLDLTPLTAWQDVYSGEFRFAGLTPEPGIVAFPVIVRLLIMVGSQVNLFAIFCGLLSFALSESSLVFIYLLLIATLIKLTYAKFMLLVPASILVAYFVITSGFVSLLFMKFKMLIFPTIDMGGRYAANLISINEIINSMFMPHGLSSYDRIQHSHIVDPSFHHGGSDLLNIILDFGILVIFLPILMISRFSFSLRQMFYVIFGIFPLMVKGQGVYSAGFISLVIICVALLGARKYEKDFNC